MAVYTMADRYGYGTGYFNTPTITATATGSQISVTYSGLQVRADYQYISASVSRYYQTYLYCTGLGGSGLLSTPTVANSSVYATLASKTVTGNTSNWFSSSNPTERTVTRILRSDRLDIEGTGAGSALISPSADVTVGYVAVTLDAPPTYDLSTLSIDTPYIYTGLTTASVTVSNLSAKYGGTITDVTFTIGNTSVSRADAGTLSILLDTVGTFTPTVTVTDSRGQTTTKTLDPITVNGYVAPSVSFTADRTLASGVPDDEGTYATIDATLTFTDVVADAVAPSVVLTDENGTQTTPSVTWYSSRATDGTLSGSATWANLSSGDTVYGLIPNVNTQYSYQISVRPRDSQGTGTAITQTLSSAFYTVDFLAGGHGIAFGKPASNVGFECAMDATFEETLTAQDMTAQEIDDFVDSIGGGGDSIAEDMASEAITQNDLREILSRTVIDADVEALDAKATLFRVGRIRVLKLDKFKISNGLTIPSADRPQSTQSGTATRIWSDNETYGAIALLYVYANGTVAASYWGTYNNSSGATVATGDDRITGTVFWYVTE